VIRKTNGRQRFDTRGANDAALIAGFEVGLANALHVKRPIDGNEGSQAQEEVIAGPSHQRRRRMKRGS
jgi:hypothetical protein